MRCGVCLGACGVGTQLRRCRLHCRTCGRLAKKLLYLSGCGVEEFLTEQTEGLFPGIPKTARTKVFREVM